MQGVRWAVHMHAEVAQNGNSYGQAIFFHNRNGDSGFTEILVSKIQYST